MSGPGACARVSNDPAALALVVHGVQSARLALIPLAALIVLAAFYFVPSLATHPEFLLWTLVYAVMRGFNPFWFFQGMEQLKGAVIIETVTKAAAALGVFVVIRDPADGWRVLAL